MILSVSQSSVLSTLSRALQFSELPLKLLDLDLSLCQLAYDRYIGKRGLHVPREDAVVPGACKSDPRRAMNI
jgi:hypothetical protein